MTLFEVNQAAAIIKETAHPEVNLIFGAVIDPNMGEEIRVTVIATGFERTGMPRRTIERPQSSGRPVRSQSSAAASLSSASSNAAAASVPAEVSAQPHAAQRNSELSDFQTRSFNPEDLDIPAFLRRR